MAFCSRAVTQCARKSPWALASCRQSGPARGNVGCCVRRYVVLSSDSDRLLSTPDAWSLTNLSACAVVLVSCGTFLVPSSVQVPAITGILRYRPSAKLDSIGCLIRSMSMCGLNWPFSVCSADALAVRRHASESSDRTQLVAFSRHEYWSWPSSMVRMVATEGDSRMAPLMRPGSFSAQAVSRSAIDVAPAESPEATM